MLNSTLTFHHYCKDKYTTHVVQLALYTVHLLKLTAIKIQFKNSPYAGYRLQTTVI